MDDAFETISAPRPGFRLRKLEVYNWGTFDSTDGQVHSVRPEGETTLLIGQNGSGKSTLVDALLTLLVRPVVRNYNVAAGAHKQERDERTYIRGAYGRFSRDEDNRADVQFLRSQGANYSALLASFANEDTGAIFTVAQVLYLNSDGRAEKVYCLASDDRSIAADCSGLTGTAKMRQQMESRGFRATTKYSEYHSWLSRVTGMRPKAMDMFNQTVAVKDIQSLNRFIREHMLERKPWGEKVERLLNHFTQLSEAHNSLVRVRRQHDLLSPIETLGAAFQEQAQHLAELQRLVEAADSFFRQMTVELLTPEQDNWKGELTVLTRKKERLDEQIESTEEEARRLRNELDSAGGERLRQIPLLIQNQEAYVSSKKDSSQRYHEALHAAGVTPAATDGASFEAIKAQLPELAKRIADDIVDHTGRRDELVVRRAELTRALREHRGELDALGKRRTNLPEVFAELRRRVCLDLRLPERDLPYAAELISVAPDEQEWEASLEMVLRSFGLSLLVPQRYYSVVSRYVDRTRLSDGHGRGQRLVYLRVGEQIAPSITEPGPQSLLQKLVYREGHPLLPWVQAELSRRFDYQCCDTIAEFQSARHLALTRQRHLKIRGIRHEKDDRDRATASMHFVLGWNNEGKRSRLRAELERIQLELDSIGATIEKVEGQLRSLGQRQAAVTNARAVATFDDIDFARHQRALESLRLEKRMLEEQSDVVRTLKHRLGETEARRKGLQASRDRVLENQGELKRQVKESERLIANAQSTLRERESDGQLAKHVSSFEALCERFGEGELHSSSLVEQERKLKDELRQEGDRLRRAMEPAQHELTKAMNRFLRDFPDERDDLEADVDYLNDYLTLQKKIQQEDLPRHEQRFKERLNEKVIQEIGLLSGALQAERTEISSKIDLLNESLRQLEYRAGTYMQLEPRPVRDKEIAEFQGALKECLAGTFEGTLEADEARFVRIEKLITRLREESRWRDKVTDVRRWFDFVARELEEDSGAERGYYEDSTGQSGGEKAKLAFTILVAAIAYQYDINPEGEISERLHFVVVDEMFSKVDDQYAEYALELFRKFGLQLLIVAPLDAKARVTEPYVGCYLHVVKDEKSHLSELFSMTSREFEEAIVTA